MCLCGLNFKLRYSQEMWKVCGKLLINCAPRSFIKTFFDINLRIVNNKMDDATLSQLSRFEECLGTGNSSMETETSTGSGSGSGSCSGYAANALSNLLARVLCVLQAPITQSSPRWKVLLLCVCVCSRSPQTTSHTGRTLPVRGLCILILFVHRIAHRYQIRPTRWIFNYAPSPAILSFQRA